MATAGSIPPSPWGRDKESEDFKAAKEFFNAKNLKKIRFQSKWAFILAILSIIFAAVGLLK